MPALTHAVGWRQPLHEGDWFTFVVPAGWARVRLRDADSRRADVEELATALTRDRPDRHQTLVAHLHDAAGSWHDPHAVEAHLSTTLGGGPPMACALVVSMVPDGTLGPGAEVLPHDAGHVERRESRTAQALLVQHLFRTAGAPDVLLSWSTPQPDLAEPLRALFDAVAGSFRRLA